MTETTETTTTDDAEPAELTLAEQHRAAKLRIASVIHQAAEGRGWCTDFDRILIEAGLPVRECNNYDFTPKHRIAAVEGEDTVEAFEAWKRNAARVLSYKAGVHGIEGCEKTFEAAGLPTAIKRDVFIEGTFRVPMTVNVIEGDDLITGTNARAVRDTVTNRFLSGDFVTWKLVTE